MDSRPRPRPRPRDLRHYRNWRQVSTGIDRWRHDRWPSANGVPMWRGHSCLRGHARADRNVCPTLPAVFKPLRLYWDCPLTQPPSTPADPRRPPSKLIADGGAPTITILPEPPTQIRGHLRHMRLQSMTSAVEPIPLLASLASWRFKTSSSNSISPSAQIREIRSSPPPRKSASSVAQKTSRSHRIAHDPARSSPITNLKSNPKSSRPPYLSDSFSLLSPSDGSRASSAANWLKIEGASSSRWAVPPS